MCNTLLPHSHPRPIFPAAKRVWFGDAVPPHTPLASLVWDPGSSARMPQNAPPSVPSSPTPLHCTTTGTSIAPLETLAWRLEPWLTPPSPSRWLTSPNRLGYAIQFARRPPKFNGVLETSVFTSSYPRKVVTDQSWIGESWTGLCTSSRSRCWRGGALTNAYSPRIGSQRSTWWTLTFMFRSFCDTDRSYSLRLRVRHGSTRSSPSGSPCAFRKVEEGALSHLWEVGVRVPNYLDNWPILAQSREQLCDHRDLVLQHGSAVRVNWEKSKLSPVQRISFLGVELDSVSMTARLTDERAQATAWVHSEAGMWYHWNSFRGSWGIWHP